MVVVIIPAVPLYDNPYMVFTIFPYDIHYIPICLEIEKTILFYKLPKPCPQRIKFTFSSLHPTTKGFVQGQKLPFPQFILQSTSTDEFWANFPKKSKRWRIYYNKSQCIVLWLFPQHACKTCQRYYSCTPTGHLYPLKHLWHPWLSAFITGCHHFQF